LIECVDDAMVRILRGKTPAECVVMIADANDAARLLAAAGVRHLHPDWSEPQVQAEVARGMLDAAN
jgi:hypothetical protein